MKKSLLLFCAALSLSSCTSPAYIGNKQAKITHDSEIVSKAFTPAVEQKCLNSFWDEKNHPYLQLVGHGYYNGRYSEYSSDKTTGVVFSIPVRSIDAGGDFVINEMNCHYQYDPKDRTLTFVNADWYIKL